MSPIALEPVVPNLALVGFDFFAYFLKVRVFGLLLLHKPSGRSIIFAKCRHRKNQYAEFI